MIKHAAQRQPSRLIPILLIVVAVALAGTGGWFILQGSRSEPPAAAPVPAETFEFPAGEVDNPIDSPIPSLGAISERTKIGRSQVPSNPLNDNRLVIPAVGVDAELSPQGLATDSSLILPTDVDQITYWTGSSPLSAPDGGILVAGHVDNAEQGEGALYQLHTLLPGDAVYLTKDGGVTRWKVIRMERYVKQRLPDWVFAGEGGPRELHLVTCGGEVVRDAEGYGTYLENVVVTAVPF